jgi:hypothetical protein
MVRKVNCLFRFFTAVFFLFCFVPLVSAATIDVMIVYDSTAKSWVDSNGGMNAFAADAVARMNQATLNSNIGLTFRLVYVAQVSYTYSGDLGTDLGNLQAGTGNLSVVHQWRDTYGADLVVLLEDTGLAYGWVGVGYLLETYSGDPDHAFTASAIRSVDISHTLTHEVGHNLGAHHSKYQADSPGPNYALNSYSAGWYFTGTNATKYHTIMAYNSDGYGNTYTEAPLFSTPWLFYQGVRAGTPADGDNSRTIGETMNVVASYRAAIDNIAISPENADFGVSGGVGSITVTTSWDEVSWTAASGASWITITSGASGTGSGTIAYRVVANETGLDRTGTITVEGMTFTVRQEGDPTITLSPESANFDIPGGLGSVMVTAVSSGFSWTATSNVSWITITSGATGTGNGTIAYSVVANGTICSSRQGTITVAGMTFTAVQSGPVVNCWREKADLLWTAGGGEVGFSIGNKGYIGTGYAGSWPYITKAFWEYDPGANTWTQKADFGGVERRFAVGFSIGNKGYMGTGQNYYEDCYNDFWEYDPATNFWTQKAAFGGTARGGAVGFSIGSKGYIGTGGAGSRYKDFWEYDPATNLWTKKADFGGTEQSSAVGFSIGRKGYIGTGIADSWPYIMKDFWEYDPATNLWTKKADFGGAGRAMAVGFSIGSKGYIGTGYNDSYLFMKDFWEYDPAANAWIQKADLASSGTVGFSIGSKGYIGKDFWEYDPGPSPLYADFTAYGLYKYDGSIWTLINGTHPASMTASGSTLCVDFAAYGLYKYDGSIWTLINGTHPASMTASGSTLYVDFTAYGLYKYFV